MPFTLPRMPAQDPARQTTSFPNSGRMTHAQNQTALKQGTLTMSVVKNILPQPSELSQARYLHSPLTGKDNHCTGRIDKNRHLGVTEPELREHYRVAGCCRLLDRNTPEEPMATTISFKPADLRTRPTELRHAAAKTAQAGQQSGRLHHATQISRWP